MLTHGHRRPLPIRPTATTRAISTTRPLPCRFRAQPAPDDASEDAERLHDARYCRWQERIEADPYRALFWNGVDTRAAAAAARSEGKRVRREEWLRGLVGRWMGVEAREEAETRNGGGEGVDTDRESRRGGRVAYMREERGVESPSDPRRPREGMGAGMQAREDGAEKVEERTVFSAGGPRRYDQASENTHTAREGAVDRSLSGRPKLRTRTRHMDGKARRMRSRERTAAPSLAQEQVLTDMPVTDAGARSREATENSLNSSLLEKESMATDLVDVDLRAAAEAPDVIAIPPSTSEESAKLGDHEHVSSIDEPIDSERLLKSQPSHLHRLSNDSNSANPRDTTREQGSSRKATSEILGQLPKDDLDFLTADSIRSSMGRIKNREDKNAIRQKLEQGYRDKQNAAQELEPLIEAKVLNDQYVRRRKGELTQPLEQTDAEPSTTPLFKLPSEDASPPISPETKNKPNAPHTPHVSVLETSLDFMSRFLHNGGNILAQHFWQDPVHVVAGMNPGADEEFLKGIGIGVLKGRRAFLSIQDELLTDVPASKDLVTRLNRDQLKASAGAVRMYKDLPAALRDGRDAAASKAAAYVRIGKLRQALLDTDKQYKEACAVVDEMKSASKPTLLLQTRLRVAADILRKNAQLTRMAVFGLQARIEVDVGAAGGLIARELLHRLLALQDTQLALSRLVSRTMQVLGVESEGKQQIAFKIDEPGTFAADLSDPSVVEALTSAAEKSSSTKGSVDAAAANAQMEEEVDKQKAAMRGLSDDGYARAPKPRIRRSFDGPNPLAHSLFRPFGLQLDSLGKDVDAEKEDEVNAAQKTKGDRELVKEVRKAYEDVYGTIGIDHQQVPAVEAKHDTVVNTTKVDEMEAQASNDTTKMDDILPTSVSQASLPEESPTSAAQETTITHDTVFKDDIGQEVSSQNVLPGYLRLQGALSLQSQTLPNSPAQSVSPLPSETTKAQETATISLKEEISGRPQPLAADSADSQAAVTNPTYQTLIYNSDTENLTIASSPISQSPPEASYIPLHEALAQLTHPAKFIDHLPPIFHVISATPTLLTILPISETTADPTASTTTVFGKSDGLWKVDADVAPSVAAEPWKGINPVDGTTTLSPTGFVGVGSDLESDVDFAERRRKAQEVRKFAEAVEREREQNEARGAPRGRRRVGGAGVVKTAIWAGAICYVTGVVAELVR